jgi:hypothetical protein
MTKKATLYMGGSCLFLWRMIQSFNSKAAVRRIGQHERVPLRLSALPAKSPSSVDQNQILQQSIYQLLP